MNPQKIVAVSCLIVGIVGMAGHALPAVEEKGEQAQDVEERVLKEHKIGTDDASLLEFLRKRSASDADLKNRAQLIRQLGSRDFDAREQASRKLIDLGLVALPELRQAAKDADVEIVRLAKACMEEIVRDAQGDLPLAAVRLLLRRQPERTIETLLRYLPFVADEVLEEEISFGLDGLAMPGGKLHPALMAALTDALPARRAVAACIVGRQGNDEQRTAVRKLLADADPMVRLRAAQGLLLARDKAVVPVLVSLLKEPAVELSWQAEELLHWIAIDSGPEPVVGAATPRERQECHAAWEGWWAKHGPKLDWDAVAKSGRRPGLYLVCEHTRLNKDWTGAVWLSGSNGRPRWRLRDIPLPQDVQFLAGNRILLVDAGFITERDMQGKLLAHISQEILRVPLPLVTAHRMPDGRTFGATVAHLFELSHEGKVHALYGGGVDRIYDAQQLPYGRTCLLGELRTGGSVVLEFNNVGDFAAKTITLDQKLFSHGRLESLSSNPYLLARDGVVFEVDRNGKTVWKYQQPGVQSATRLLNGNTLIFGWNMGRGQRLEVDPSGQTVSMPTWRADGSHVHYHRIRKCLAAVQLGSQPSAIRLLDPAKSGKSP